MLLSNPIVSLDIVLFNVRSLLSVERRQALANAVLKSEAHILALNETWLLPDVVSSELFLENFCIYRNDRKSDDRVSKHGGVLPAIKNSIPHSISRNHDFSDVLFCNVLSGTPKALTIVCFYNPPHGSPYQWTLSKWDGVLSFLKSITDIGDNIMLIGDANMPNTDWETLHSEVAYEDALLNKFSALNLSQLVAFQTTKTKCLDIVLVSSEKNILNVQPDDCLTKSYSIGDRLLSDHSAVRVSVDAWLNETITKPKKKFSFGKADFELLQNAVLENAFIGRCWSNPNVLVSEWYDWLNTLLAYTVPMKTSHRLQLPPWITTATSHQIKQLRTKERIYQKKPSSILFSKIERLRSSLQTAMSDDQSNYEAELAKGRSTTKLFKYFKSLRKSDPLPPKLTWMGKTACSCEEQASLLNLYFQSVFVSSDVSVEYEPELPRLQSITDYDVSLVKIKSIFETLDITKSRGPDSLPPILFRKVPALASSLASIFYKIKQTSVYPDCWKIGKVTPLFKKGDRQLVSNYRPITLLNICSKIFEKCVFDALYPFVSPLIHSNQFGFQKKKSTIVQLVCYLDEIYKGINNSCLAVETVYLDFAKAFDKINHKVLLKKLRLLGVGGKLFSILSSYLSNRKQFVEISGFESDLLSVLSGVPQGSILGPLLFLIYVLDLPHNLKSIPFMFADDTKLLSLRQLCLTSTDLQSDLDCLSMWSERNMMEFNIDKCNILLFRSNNSNIPLLHLCGKTLNTTHSEKDLGVLVSHDLKWSEHIKEAVRKANSVLFLIKRNCSATLPVKHKLNMYKSMVIPVISYGSSVWYANKSNWKILEGVQRHATRWILGYNNDLSYSERLLKLNLLPLSLYFQLNDVLLLQKILNNYYNIDWTHMITFSRDSYRASRNLSRKIFELPRLKLDICRANFWYRTARLANILYSTTNLDVRDVRSIKNALLAVFWDHFRRVYQSEKPCTWVIGCLCADCRVVTP